MNAILTKDCAMVPLYHIVSFGLSQPWSPRMIHNSLASSSNGLKYSFLDPIQREEARREWNRTSYWPLGIGTAIILGVAVLGVVRVMGRNV
jgi:hypothetical protein